MLTPQPNPSPKAIHSEATLAGEPIRERSHAEPVETKAASHTAWTVVSPQAGTKVIALIQASLDRSSVPSERRDRLAELYKPLEEVLGAGKAQQKVRIRHNDSVAVLDVRTTPEGFRILIPHVFSKNNHGLAREILHGLALVLDKHVARTGTTTQIELIAQNVSNARLSDFLENLGFQKRSDIGWTTGQKVLAGVTAMTAALAYFVPQAGLGEIAFVMAAVFLLTQGTSAGVKFSMTPGGDRQRAKTG